MLVKYLVTIALLLGWANCENSTAGIELIGLPANYIRDQFIEQIIKNPLKMSLCEKQLLTLTNNIKKKKNYLKSFRFFDAWGKIPAGITYGHLEDIGNFRQCITIDYDLPMILTKKKSHFVGQYCHAKIPITSLGNNNQPTDTFIQMRSGVDEPVLQTLGLGIGICVPESCSPEQITKTLSESLNGIKVLVDLCSTDKKPDLKPLDIFALCVFGVITLLIVLSTAYDYFTASLNLERRPILLVFSLTTNCQKLFAVNLKKNPNSIDCIHGIRALSMVWVLYGHTVLIIFARPTMNYVDAYHFLKSTFALFLLTAPISVDTFFFISGFLIAWVGLGAIAKSKGRMNIPLMYVQRYLRLTPMVAIMMLFVVTFYKFCGNGPNFKSTISGPIHSCQIGWWRNLLYIQNYFDDDICIAQSWYLAVDTQLYLFAPFLLMGFYKWGNKFIAVLVLLIAAGVGGIYALFIENQFKSVIPFLEAQMLERARKVYFPTYTRFPPWLIGSICGYLMYNLKGKEVKLPKLAVVIGWIVALGTMLAIIFGPKKSMESFGQTTAVEAASYEAFSRISWAISLGWVVFACHHGYGGVINDFLGHHQWQVLSRLSFAIYLVHMTFQSFIVANTKTESVFSEFELAGMFWLAFGISTLFAVLLILVCESPVIQLEKLLLAPKPKTELPISQTTAAPIDNTSKI